jgi:TRAP-type C4-dicarboxylate transport system permease small subunit
VTVLARLHRVLERILEVWVMFLIIALTVVVCWQ